MLHGSRFGLVEFVGEDEKKQQVPPLRYAPVGMTILFRIRVVPKRLFGMGVTGRSLYSVKLRSKHFHDESVNCRSLDYARDDKV